MVSIDKLRQVLENWELTNPSNMATKQLHVTEPINVLVIQRKNISKLWTNLRASPYVVSVHPTHSLDPVLPITHCAFAIIGGHFLDVEKSEN